MRFRFTQLSDDSITAINQVIESSIQAWQLSDRLYRLSINAYRYSPSDWIDHRFYGLMDQNNTLVGVLVFNEDASELPDYHQCLQIHGLYVCQNRQGQGVGSQCIDEAVILTRKLDLNALFVKAHESAVGFFKHQGFNEIPVQDALRDYPHRLVRSVI